MMSIEHAMFADKMLTNTFIYVCFILHVGIKIFSISSFSNFKTLALRRLYIEWVLILCIAIFYLHPE